MKRITAFLAFLIIAALALAACSAPGGSGAGASPSGSAETAVSPDSAYHKITAEEAKKMIDAGGVTIVDVRTAEEYAEKHIPGAVLVPNESIGEDPPEQLPDQDAVLLVHCRTGVRSRQASDKLVGLGYTQIYDFGGIADWPYETESGPAE